LLVHQHQNSLQTINETINNVSLTRIKKLFTLLYSPISLSFLAELNKNIRETQPDILHIHMPNLSAFWCLFSKEARKIPWVVHWHADVIGSVPDWRIKIAYQGYRIFERLLLNRANAIIATSPPYLQFSKPLENFKTKTHVIPLGLAVSNAQLTTEFTEVDREKKISLLIIGRLTYYKGHKYLLDALAKTPDVELTIIGVGELEKTLKQQVEQLGLEKRVKFLGKVNDEILDQNIKKCDLLCLPSIEKTEAFGVVLLEAARLEKPSLVTAVKGSGMSWVVEDKKTGIVVVPNSVAALVEGIQFSCDNQLSLIEYGKAARKKFEKQFSIDEISKNTVELYRNVLKV
jgi:rhamnosyl/mannosyltransferase